MMMREQQWDRSNCRHFRIDVCLHQRIYKRAFVNARKKARSGSFSILYYDHTILEIYSFFKQINLCASGF